MQHAWLQATIKTRWKTIQQWAAHASDPVSYHKRQIRQLKDESATSSVLDYLLHALSILVDEGGCRDIKLSGRERLLRECEKILKVLSVKNNDQQGQLLVGLYHLAYLKVARDMGEPFQARWHGMVALKLLQHDSLIDKECIEIEVNKLNARLGEFAKAESGLSRLLASEWQEGTGRKFDEQMLLSTLFRLRGRHDVAKVVLDRVECQTTAQERRVQWQQEVNQLDPNKSMQKFMRIGDMCCEEGAVSESLRTILFSLGTQTRRWMEKLPNQQQFVRRHYHWLKESPLVKKLFESVKIIMQFYDTEVSLFQRRNDLLKMLDSRSQLPSIEDELLVLVASYRALTRLSQHELALYPKREYERLSETVSFRQSRDVLGLLADVDLSHLENSVMDGPELYLADA